MTPEEPFIPPPPEPAPVEPTAGAGTMPRDPDQSGVSQDPMPDLDEAEHAALLATVGGVTAHAVLAYAASLIGLGESPSNVNRCTRWFYGNATPAAWCWIFLCYVFNHLKALSLIFGKHAYVPDFRAVFSPHGEFHTSNPKPGDLVAFDFNFSGEPEHIGIVEKVLSGSYIQTIEGNTSDHVMRRTRWRGYVYAYATPKYGTHPQEDDVQLTDKVPTSHWISNRWPGDPYLKDGMTVAELLENSYGNARVAKEASERLEKAVADLAQAVAELKAKNA